VTEENNNIGEEEAGSSEGGRTDSKTKSPYQKVEISEAHRQGAMEVTVDNNIEKALKILKRKLIKEGLFKELKLRRYYEKPSERKKRKLKESVKKLRKEESRMKKNPHLYS
jgi:small subunit ribosomal protein S21